MRLLERMRAAEGKYGDQLGAADYLDKEIAMEREVLGALIDEFGPVSLDAAPDVDIDYWLARVA